MHKEHIVYEDYNGEKREEDFFFNLSQAEIIDWLTTSGDYTLDKVMERLAKERNGKEIMKIFKDLIYRAYGEKSLDGRRFIKTEEVKANFMETEAYSQLFTSLVTDASKAADFISKVIPAKLSEEVNKVMAENPNGIPDTIKDYIPAAGGPTIFPLSKK